MRNFLFSFVIPTAIVVGGTLLLNWLFNEDVNPSNVAAWTALFAAYGLKYDLEKP